MLSEQPTNEPVTITLHSCHRCPYCVILPDPEPGDWFCNDSQKAVCRHPKLDDKTEDDREIEPYIRPHQVERDLAMRGIPTWCPLRLEA